MRVYAFNRTKHHHSAARDPQEQALERWLREEVVPACDELQKDPSTGRTAEQARQTLANEYKKMLKAG